MLHPEIESLDRDDMAALQSRKLAALGKRLAASPEWCAHFAKAGMHPRDLAAPDGLAHAPTLEKADLRAHAPFPMLTVEVSRVARFFATSGTTGQPVLFGFTEGDLKRLACQVARHLRCAGVRPGDRVYQGFGYGLWIGGPAHDLGLRELGATCIPVGPGRSELVIEWLRDLAIDAATASPLFLAHLVRAARERGIDPKKEWRLRTAIVGGQSVSLAFREQLEAGMPHGFRAHNNYGATESGGPNLATACPHSLERDEMHLLNEDALVTEILDPKTLQPVGPGEVGEVVVTTLDKEASPVVRWRTRDLVHLSAKPRDCECGRRGMPLIGRIIGRSDDALKVRGVLVFPSQVEDVIAGTPGTVKEAWQIYVDTMDGSPKTMTVAIECETGCPGDASKLASTVAHSLQSRLGLKVPVECHPQGTLPRYEAKARRVLLKEEP
ncbi:MAG: acyl--CoA ligase [Betaproteobacteria bacterium RIFCSPLOWO2_12_FULL_68_20]|nr:MAG: acyl--CoA ligase [Betaproteobacteria bacterium RIFCSPLOWO2_12_FULL_68_20]